MDGMRAVVSQQMRNVYVKAFHVYCVRVRGTSTPNTLYIQCDDASLHGFNRKYKIDIKFQS